MLEQMQDYRTLKDKVNSIDKGYYLSLTSKFNTMLTD